MISVPASLAVGVLLFGFCLLVARGKFAARRLESSSELILFDEGSELPACPSEFFARVFSDEDAVYVLAINSPELVKFFVRERKQVALAWIQQTSAIVQRTMDEHKAIARVSRDLVPATEVRLWCSYYWLMFVCGALSSAVQLLGPTRLRTIAVYADAHSQRLARVQQSFKAVTSPREFPRVGAA